MSASGPPAEPGAPPPPGRLRVLALLAALLVVFLVGAFLAVAERAGCLRHVPRPGPVAPVPPPVPPDSAGALVDTGDSLLNLGADSGPAELRPGFDLWARAVSSLLHPAADTLPSVEKVRGLLDSLHLPAEVSRAAGDAGAVAVTFRPRSAVRARAAYLFYALGPHVGYLAPALENPQRWSAAGWHAGGELRVAAAGIVPGPDGPRPALVALSLKGGAGWSPWDTLPSPDSLVGRAGSGGASGPAGSGASAALAGTLEPGFLDQPGQAPLFVVRRPAPRVAFEECADCPHRYLDRIWRIDGEHFLWLSEQPEETPYAALSNFLGALLRGDRDGASRYAWDPAVTEAAEGLRLSAGVPERSWRLLPGQQAADTVLTALRLGVEPLRFHVQYDGSHWRVAAVERVGGRR